MRQNESQLIVYLCLTIKGAVLVFFITCLSCHTAKNVAGGRDGTPYTFFVLGDWGMRGGFYQRPVADQMIRQAAIDRPAMILTVGDNFYDVGAIKSIRDEQWDLSWENVYGPLTRNYSWYVSLGNHDYQGSVQAQIDYHTINPNWNLPERYYTFVRELPKRRKMRIVMIDTSPYITGYYKDAKYKDSLPLQDTAKQTRWLDSVLANAKEDWKIVVGHHPVYNVGGNAEDYKAMRGAILPLFEKYRVQAYISGHDHVIQYHLPKAGGTGYIISGTGAKPVKPPGKEAYTLYSGNSPAFTVCSIEGDRFSFSFIDTTGKKLYSNLIHKNIQ